MKKQSRIACIILSCTVAFSSMAVAGDNPYQPEFTPETGTRTLQFTGRTVAGKTMVSSGYANGSMTFNSNGSLTCTNYPSFIGCKHWQVQHDGTLRREFTDSHTGKTVEVVAIWKLLSQSGNTLQVQQTSNNSDVATTVTVTIK